jgi:hypothetical protein
VPHNILFRQFAKAHGRRAIRLPWAEVGGRHFGYSISLSQPYRTEPDVNAALLLECQRFARLGNRRKQHTPLALLQNAL